MIAARFQALSVTGKLTLISLVTSVVGLLVAAATMVTDSQLSYRNNLARDLHSMADMVGLNSSAAITFGDNAAAAQMLRGLQAQPRILSAALYTPDGRLFADYRRQVGGTAAPAVPRPPGEYFGRYGLELFQSVVFNSETIGTIYLHADLREVWSNLGHDVMTAAFATGIAAALAAGLARRLQAIIARPFNQLVGIVQQVASRRDYSLRASPGGSDEIGRLIHGFNDMLGQIQERDQALEAARDRLEERVTERTQQLEMEIAERERLHRQLVDASRQAGMAEVATGVLHNVGNVLNSVNVSATLVINSVRRTKAVQLERLGAMLESHQHDLGAFLTTDPKGAKIPAFVSRLASDLAAERTTAATELEQLRENIEHVKEIVNMQQSYAKVSGVTETLQLSELAEDALKLNAGALARHAVSVVRDYGALCQITTERHKVLQVLVNLIRNAKYACDESMSPRREITLRITFDRESARIAVIDNGIGIPAENLTRIFNHGFTTRKTGHGFGLHSGALVAKELGGALRAASPGPNLGASFTLELPLQPPAA